MNGTNSRSGRMRHFGTIVSFDLRAGAGAGDRFADNLRLFAIAASMGSPVVA